MYFDASQIIFVWKIQILYGDPRERNGRKKLARQIPSHRYANENEGTRRKTEYQKHVLIRAHNKVSVIKLYNLTM